MISEIDGVSILKKLELAGKNCYKSENNITDDSYIKFIEMIIKNNHHSVLEHSNITLRWITDRGVMSELTRHRIASYSIESTRYCSYKGDIEFIKPVDFEFSEDDIELLIDIEKRYHGMLNSGYTPQQARAILPNCLKTDIVFTMNLREFRHMLSLRCHRSSHPQMVDIARKTLKLLTDNIPIIFDDLYDLYFRNN